MVFCWRTKTKEPEMVKISFWDWLYMFRKKEDFAWSMASFSEVPGVEQKQLDIWSRKPLGCSMDIGV